METPKSSQHEELKLTLTDEQRREIVKFIAATGGNPNLHVNVVFEADASTKSIAPATVLVGAAM